MPRRKLHLSQEFQGYGVNASADEPVYVAHLQTIIRMVQSCSLPGSRWETTHIVLWLKNEKTSISKVMRDLQRSFSANSFRYFWAREDASDAMPGTPGIHFHIAVFFNAQIHSFSTLNTALHELVKKSVLHQYKHIPPKQNRIKNPDISDLFADEEDPKFCLDLRRKSNVIWAIYWFSYLAKTASKESTPGRTFGASSLKTKGS